MAVLDARIFLVINTTEYNKDGKVFYTNVKGVEGCESMGWREVEHYKHYKSGTSMLIDDMLVGDMVISEDYEGAYLMRIA